MAQFRGILAEVDSNLTEEDLDGIIAEIDEDGSGENMISASQSLLGNQAILLPQSPRSITSRRGIRTVAKGW